MTESKKRLLLTTIIFIIVLSIGLSLIYLKEQKRIIEIRKIVAEVAAAQAYSISRQLDRSLSATYALASLIQQYGEINNFDTLAADMIERYGGISSLQLAPNAVVRQISPLQGNEAAIGHDLLNDPNRRSEAMAAIKFKKLTLAGPLNLIQGGVAVIGRYPVFVPDKNTSEESFWGFTIALIRLPGLLKTSNINQLIGAGYNYELSRINNDSNEKFVFDKTDHEIIHNPVNINIEVPNGQWSLSIAPQKGWKSPSFLYVEVLITFFVSVVISFLFYQRSKNISELSKTNKLLGKEIIGHKQAEEAMRSSEERYRTLVEDMPAMVCRFQPDGKLTFVNEDYSKHFSKKSEELINDNFFQFIPEDEKEMVRAHLRSLDKENPIRSYEHHVIGSNGDLRWHQWIDRALINEQGEVAEYQSIGIDITEKKKTEEELQRRHKLESVGILAGGIAHDFNNLLAAIMNNVHLSRMYVDRESKAYDHLENTEKALGRAGDLTQQLLTFSRGGEPVKKTTAIVEIIKEFAEFALRGSNVNCEYNLTDNLWPVEVDQSQISQVIQNLVINAKQSMPEGGTIHVRAENAMFHSGTDEPLQGGRYVKITVHDHGIGIALEHLQKIFDPYFTTKDTGRGLGLAIAYSIIKKHEGHISVESQLGGGSTFTVYLPASEKYEKHVDSSEPYEDTALVGEGRVLIMDDEEMVRNSLGEVLAVSGYEVEYAKDGKEAIELYEKSMKLAKPFNAVILDLTVPGGMGGKEAIKKLLAIDPNVKAIVSSGYSSDPVMANFREYGFSNVIAKPYKSPPELNKILHIVINGLNE